MEITLDVLQTRLAEYERARDEHLRLREEHAKLAEANHGAAEAIRELIRAASAPKVEVPNG